MYQIPYLEAEITKLKISIPLGELVRNYQYISQILKELKVDKSTNTVNIADDHPTIIFGPKIDGKGIDGDIPPFYVSLNVHEKTLHNAMLEFGASHNLMPKVIMKRLGLDITRP